MKEGWEIKKIVDVVDFFRGLTYSKNDEVEISSNIVLRATNIDLKTNNLDFSELKYLKDSLLVPKDKKVRKGSLIICTASGSKSHLGKVALIDKDYQYAFGGFMGQLIPRSIIDPKFLFYVMTSEFYRNFISKLSDGVNINNLRFDDLGQFSFPLPSLKIQLRIVAILDHAFAAIAKAKENAEKNLKNAQELFASYLQGAFEKKVRGERFESLESLCEFIVDCEHKTAPIQESGYPSIRTPNIGKGELILENVNCVSYETYTKWTKRAVPKAGDLILAREASAGNIAVIPENFEVCLGQRTVLLRPKQSRLIPKYLAYLVLSKNVQEILLSHSTGATVQHVNMKDIRAFKIYDLSNLDEQQSIVSQLDALRVETKMLEAIYQQKLVNLEEMKKSILQKAFAGELNTGKVRKYE